MSEKMKYLYAMVTNIAICGVVAWALYITKNLWSLLGLLFIIVPKT